MWDGGVSERGRENCGVRCSQRAGFSHGAHREVEGTGAEGRRGTRGETALEDINEQSGR